MLRTVSMVVLCVISFIIYNILFLVQSPRHFQRPVPKESFSGLWEFYYDSDSDEGRERGGGEVTGRGGDEEGEKMRNIRGFLFKRRKSPLKGWHKVSSPLLCK